MGHPTRRATAMFQTFAVEVLNSFWLLVNVVEEQMMLIIHTMYINQGEVREKDPFPYHSLNIASSGPA